MSHESRLLIINHKQAAASPSRRDPWLLFGVINALFPSSAASSRSVFYNVWRIQVLSVAFEIKSNNTRSWSYFFKSKIYGCFFSKDPVFLE